MDELLRGSGPVLVLEKCVDFALQVQLDDLLKLLLRAHLDQPLREVVSKRVEHQFVEVLDRHLKHDFAQIAVSFNLGLEKPAAVLGLCQRHRVQHQLLHAMDRQALITFKRQMVEPKAKLVEHLRQG